MALYGFKCEYHGEFEKEFSMAEVPKETICPICGKWSNKQYYPTPAQFMGRGWGSKP